MMTSKEALDKLWNYFDYFCTIGVITKDEEKEIDDCFYRLNEEVQD